jgi:hypothetical protein
MIVGVLGLLTALAASPALAVKTRHFVEAVIPPGREVTVTGTAVDEATGDLYVVNVHTPEVLYHYGPNGRPAASQPRIAVPSGFSLFTVAVDNSTGAAAGDIYLGGLQINATAGGVFQLTPSGVPTSVHITASSVPANGTPQGGNRPPVVNNGEMSVESLSVSSAGELFVLDSANGAIDVFTSGGAFVEQLGTNVPAVRSATSLAVAPDGDIYLAGKIPGLFQLDGEGNCVSACTPIDSDVSGVAIAPDGTIIDVAEPPAQNISVVHEYAPDGTLESTSGAENLNSGFTLAIDASRERLYVADTASNGGRPNQIGGVKVFGPQLTLPNATTGAASGVTGDSAVLAGTVGADGGPATTNCVFEYVDQADFEATAFGSAERVPCLPPGPFTGEAENAVTSTASELSGGTTYFFRVSAENENGTNSGRAGEFTTEGPTVLSQGASEIGETSAILLGSINPNGAATEFHFEYLPESRFDLTGFAEAASIPVPNGSIGAGSGPVPVSEAITGLAPGTAYRFRLVATNPNGVAHGSSAQSGRFATFAPVAPSLPDARGYEQVSPVAKNGNDIKGEAGAAQAAADGERVTFYVNGGIPGGEGAQNFPVYVASRAPQGTGWQSVGLLPPATTGANGVVLGWDEELNSALDENVKSSEPAVLYRRMIVGGSGVSALAQGGKGRESFFYGGSSAGRVVFYENVKEKLTPNSAANAPNTYVSDASGTPHLVGVENNGKAPLGGTTVGPINWFRETALLDGAGAGYFTEADHVLSADGRFAFFTALESGQLFVRENPLSAQSPVGPGGTCTDPSEACTVELSASQAESADPNGPQPAAFIGATKSGAFAFFLSGGALTDDATTGSTDQGNDLYRYDTATHELADLVADPADSNGAEVKGVLGYGEGGNVVYFVANGVLAAGASQGTCTGIGENVNGVCNLYVWNNGTVTFIQQLHPLSGQTRSDLGDWLATSITNAGAGQEKTSRVSQDGGVLLYRSAASATAASEFYRYDLSTDSTVCVTCNPTGSAPTTGAALRRLPETLTGPRIAASSIPRNLSADGNRVFFETAERLVGGDVNGVQDVYQWEAPATANGDTCTAQNPDFVAASGGCVSLLSTGTSPDPSYFSDAGSSGDDVFFFTRQRLVAQDGDELQDLYDARVGGGITGQNLGSTEPCEGEAACAESPQGGPAVSAPGSSAFKGPGNPPPLKQCKRGFVRKHGKCVKRHAAKKTKHRKKKAKHHRGNTERTKGRSNKSKNGGKR